MVLLTVALSVLLAGSLIYCVMCIVAALRFASVRPPAAAREIPITVMRPLAGLEPGLEENLRSIFAQDYSRFEILHAVHHPGDPAAGVVEKLQRDFPGVSSRLIVTGPPSWPNHKVFSLDRMYASASFDVLVICDSDIEVASSLLQTIAAELTDGRTGLITCPYRAVSAGGIWSTLEAIGLNTEFLAGILVSRMLNGMDFAVGCTIAIRRSVVGQIGGFSGLQDFLAEDFVMGKRVAETGSGVLLSSSVIEHHVGGPRLRENLEHRLRWARSTRRSRPLGYAGQLFTFPIPLALVLWAWRPGWWPAVLVAAALRYACAWAVAVRVLHDPLTKRRWYLIPLQDLLSFLLWIAGFFGNTVSWRGRRFRLLAYGRITRGP